MNMIALSRFNCATFYFFSFIIVALNVRIILKYCIMTCISKSYISLSFPVFINDIKLKEVNRKLNKKFFNEWYNEIIYIDVEYYMIAVKVEVNKLSLL